MKVTLHGEDHVPSLGVVIGRFQVDSLTSGHRALLKYVSDRHDRILVLIGERWAPASSKHPLSYMERAHMVREYFDHYDIRLSSNTAITSVVDQRSDIIWSKNVDQLISAKLSLIGKDRIPLAVIYGGKNSFIDRYHGVFETVTIPYTHSDSGTKLRRFLIDDWNINQQQRLGKMKTIINMPHKDILMVDAAVLCRDATGLLQLLLGRKHGEDGWRLPGGHVDQWETMEAAASREVAEETCVVTRNNDWVTVASNLVVDDWRIADSPDITYRTTLMEAFVIHQEAFGSDDLAEARWFPLLSLPSIVEEHLPLIKLINEATHERMFRQ